MKNIKYVTVSDALFLGKKNHGLKIFNGDGVSIEYDETHDHVKIAYNGEVATIKHYGAIVETVGGVLKKHTAPVTRGPVKAQAATPHDHVFAGGAGKATD